MKKSTSLIPKLIIAAFGILMLFSTTLKAQLVVPLGMKYQAVARDLSGKVLANQELTLKITLYSEIERRHIEYSEQHNVKTNDIGLFDLVIGQGEAMEGNFDKVPWSSKDIWMEVAVRDAAADGFVVISNSRMLSVPYAFHAGTANELVGSSGIPQTSPGVPSNAWSLFGNSGVTENDHLGTVDCADLIIVTNDIERLRITCAGETNISGPLNVNNMSDTYLTGQLRVDKETILGSILDVSGEAGFNSNALFMSNIVVDGNAEIGGDVNILGDVNIEGALQTSNSKVSGPASLSLGGQSYVACFENTDPASLGSDGIAIKIGAAGGASNWHDNGDNDYITFYNGNGTATGSVEGFELLHDNPLATFPTPSFSDFFNIADFSGALTLPSVDWANLIDFNPPSLDIDFGSLHFDFDPGGLSVDFNNEFDPGGFNPGAFFSPSAAVGASQAISDIVCWGLANGMESLITTNPFDLLLASYVITSTNLCKENNGTGGVTYVSFGADYAEWLQRANPNENMRSGQIVGVKNGKITKNTSDAEQILAISTNPIVLGNKPPENRQDLYEKVGFMGQIPVFVQGKVTVGDYIIPSGNNDGFGKAIPPDKLSMEHIPLILGRAWSNSENDVLSVINVAVGLNRNDIAKVAMQQEKEINSLKTELTAMRSSVDNQLAEMSKKLLLMEQDKVVRGAYSKE